MSQSCKNPVVVGLDPSLNSTGLVVINHQNVLVLHKKVKSDLPKEALSSRLIDIKTQIINLLEPYKHRIHDISIEGLSFGSISTSVRPLAMLFGVLITNFEELWGKTCSVVPPTSLKFFATGSGRADKPQMFQELPEDVKEVFLKDYKKSSGLFDVTDAYHLAMYNIKGGKNDKQFPKTLKK